MLKPGYDVIVRSALGKVRHFWSRSVRDQDIVSSGAFEIEIRPRRPLLGRPYGPFAVSGVEIVRLHESAARYLSGDPEHPEPPVLRSGPGHLFPLPNKSVIKAVHHALTPVVGLIVREGHLGATLWQALMNDASEECVKAVAINRYRIALITGPDSKTLKDALRGWPSAFGLEPLHADEALRQKDGAAESIGAIAELVSNSDDAEDWSPAQWRELFDVLLAHGADVKATDGIGRPPVMVAASAMLPAALEALREIGADPDQSSGWMRSAHFEGHQRALTLLLQTDLISAFYSPNWLETLQTVAKMSSPVTESEVGLIDHALDRAASQGSLEAVETLLSLRPASAPRTNPTQHAIASASPEILKRFIAAGYDVEPTPGSRDLLERRITESEALTKRLKDTLTLLPD